MLRSALLILSGNATASLLLLLRNLLVARLIPVADYGIAATFAVAMAVVEMASALGLQQQIVQARDGDDPHFQSALQGFQVLRGALSGAVLMLIAAPMAHFLGIAQVTWAYQLLALVPVLTALTHFDIHRLNRQMVFWPLLLTGAVPALISVLVLWPLAQWFGDWRVMLYSILIQALIGTVVSHVLAKRPYRLALDPAIMRNALRFGWPLLVNAVLLFFVFQGDRLVVGRLSGMQALAIFSMGITLTLTPTLVMAKSAQNFFLPQLTRIGATPPSEAFSRMARVTLQAALMNGAVTVAVMAVLSGPIVLYLLGPRYNDLLPLLLPLAALAGMRICKSGPSVVALARGRTGNAMISNLPRLLVLPLVWYVLDMGGGLLQVIWLGLAAEAVGYALAMALVIRQGVGAPFAAIGLFLAYLAATLTVSLSLNHGYFTDWPFAGNYPGVTAVVLLPVLLIAMPDLRRYASRRGRHPPGPQP